MVRKHEIPQTKKTEGGTLRPGQKYEVGEQGDEDFIPVPAKGDIKADAVVVRGDAVPEKKG